MRASSASHRLGPQTAILEIRSAIGLLTRFPVGVAETARTGSAAFALVGAGLGFGSAVEVAFAASLVAQAVTLR